MFSEIVIWTGFTIAGWNLPALSFVIYSFCNLAPRYACAFSRLIFVADA